MTRVIATVVLAGVGTALLAADPPAPAVPKAAAIELVLLTGDRPARVELSVEVDGRPVGAAWDAAFNRIMAFCDANGDGTLSEAEAARLPSAFGVRQVLWGQVNPQAGAAPPLKELDANGDKAVSRAELAAWYRRAGVGGVTVGAGTVPGTDTLTAALAKTLDADGDGRVTETEFKDAPAALRKLDANNDDLVKPDELVARAVYPGAAGTIRLTAPGAEPAGEPAFPVLVLPADADTHWAGELARRRNAGKDGPLDAKESGFEPATFTKLDADGDGTLTPAELAGWRKLPADATWHVRLGPAKDGKAGTDGTRWEKGRVRLDLRSDDGRMAEQVAAARKRFLTQFTDADADRDGFLTADEAAKPKPSPMKPVLTAGDRDGDGKLSEKELVAWLDLQEVYAAAHVLVTILDHGAGLFEILDADHDGALSPRELRTGWGRLAAAGCATDGVFDRTKLPRQLVAVVSRGQPLSPLGRSPRPGPAWFKAMDRNGDGDVSRREFIGPPDVFDKLDLDKDGLLSSAEAEKAQKVDAKK